MKPRNSRRALIVSLIAVFVVPLAGTLVFVEHSGSRSGFEKVTGLTLLDSTDLLDHRVESLFSLADDPNHRWLLRDTGGVGYLNVKGRAMTGGTYEGFRHLGDFWPELDEPYNALEIVATIKGIRSENEYLFLTSDETISVVYSFRS